MIDIEKLKLEIVEILKPLDPNKIILFGSYVYGTPTEDSDIDLFIFKDIDKHLQREYKLKARQHMRSLISKYKIGFDLLVASETFVKSREDYFYKNDILKHGEIIYE